MVAIFLLAGAVVNLGVAWAAPLCSSAPYTPPIMITFLAPAFVASPLTQPSEEDRRWWHAERPFDGTAEFAGVLEQRRGPGWSLRHFLGGPAVRLVGGGFQTGDEPFEIASRLHAGAPVRSLTGSHWTRYGSDAVPKTTRRVSLWEQGWPSSRYTPAVAAGGVPLRPLWPGFAVNTIFYALILWLPVRGTFHLRRHIRRKHGLCVACGYDLRHADHDACPECGAVVGPSAGASG